MALMTVVDFGMEIERADLSLMGVKMASWLSQSDSEWEILKENKLLELIFFS